MSSIVKFQLPPIKGTEVFPETIKSPPVVHASVDFLVDVEDPVAPEVLEDRAKNTLAENVGVISHFVHSQRQNFNFGITDYAKASRAYPGFDVSYTNIQNRQEIVTLKMYIDVRQQKRLEEEGEDELCVVVFHDGNQISYAPMTELDNPVGTATRQILNQSNWGFKLIKSCQAKFVGTASAIYTGLNGLVSGTILKGDSFAFLTSIVETEILTDSLADREWPIMCGSGATVHIPSADVYLDNNGNISEYSPVASPGSNEQPPPYAAELKAWHLTTEGQRYYAAYFNSASAFTSSEVRMYIATDYDSTVYPTDGSNYNSYGAVYSGPSPPDLPPDSFGFILDGSWVFASATRDFNPPPNQYETLTAHLDGVPFPTFVQSENIDRIDSGYESIDAYWNADSSGANRVTTAITSVGDFLQSWKTINYEYARIYDLVRIPFPPSIDGTRWLEYHTFIPYAGNDQLVLQTSYGRLTYPTDDAGGLGGYRGWLHISNGKHVLQGFEFGKQRYVYLDGQQITSFLGVSIDDVQTVLFDIPLSKIEQFN